ncbi:trichohyalin-like [Battus philenor]|uniref:trichohyalin-like n=1 Tax=Battus philenor TaxID=42288 RepID=UPI0035D04719
MECQTSDSKKLFKVFEASKRKRKRKKRDGVDDCNSLATDDSTNASKANGRRACSAKASLQNASAGPVDVTGNTNRDSSPATSPVDVHRAPRSPRHHRRTARDGISLALKAGLVSTPRSLSPSHDDEATIESVPQDQDSFIYQFLEEAIKIDKKKQRHLRKHEEQKAAGRAREASLPREHRHHHRRHREEATPVRDRDRHAARPTEQSRSPVIDQSVLLETFAKLCAQMNRKPSRYKDNTVSRTISHKSLQCEVAPRPDNYNEPRCPDRHRDKNSPSRIRSHDNFRSPLRVRNQCTGLDERRNIADKCVCCYPQTRKHNCENKFEQLKSRSRVVVDPYYEYAADVTPTGSCIDAGYGEHRPEQREYKEYDRREPVRDRYNDDRRKYCEQKASRSFELQREYGDDGRGTARSDPHKAKRMEAQRNRRYSERTRDRYYDEKPDVRERAYCLPNKEKSRRHLEQFDRNSVVSRDIDDRDRFSEKERDSGLSGADGETSTTSGRSNYMRAVKQEIAEQREAMDKMMKLWKELMRCFKSMSQTQGHEKTVQEAESVRESAAAQLRLWRECMRRYETVARDVGDTDARLMEEISKQRSEMTEMAGMWQECLQRYRDMSNDFNSLKKQLVNPESPQRAPPPLLCAEGEGLAAAASYRLPPANYPPAPCPMPGACGLAEGAGLRGRASAPPAWWWAEGPEGAPRRRSSPDSRASRERRHTRDRRKDRDDRFKEKPSKPNAARSEHRHRKR